MQTRIGFDGTGFKLFQCQAEILRSRHRITVATTGRGVGKTVSAGHWVARRIFETASKGLIGSPSYGQTNEILTYLIELLHILGCETLLNKMAPKSWKPSIVDYRNILTVMHPNFDSCRHIHIASTDNFEALRGRSIGWMLLDEAALINEDAYYKVLLPTLRGYGASHNYQQLIITSPRGSTNWVSQLAKQVGVLHITAPSWQNIIEWPDTKIEEYRALLSDMAFRQEIAGEIIEFGASSMFYMFNKDCIRMAPDTEPDEIWVSSDQNVSPMSSLIMHRHGDVWYAYREAVVPDSANVDDMVNMLAREDMGLLGKRITLTGDSSGNNRSVVSRKSFYESLIEGLEARRIQVKNRTLRSNPSVFTTAESVNVMLQNGKLFISPFCKQLIQDLEKTRYNTDMTTDKKYYDGHLADCTRYWCHSIGKAPMATMHLGLAK